MALGASSGSLFCRVLHSSLHMGSFVRGAFLGFFFPSDIGAWPPSFILDSLHIARHSVHDTPSRLEADSKRKTLAFRSKRHNVFIFYLQWHGHYHAWPCCSLHLPSSSPSLCFPTRNNEGPEQNEKTTVRNTANEECQDATTYA